MSLLRPGLNNWIHHGVFVSEAAAAGLALPQWLESDNGALLEDFGDVSAFSLLGSGTKEENNTQTIVGGKALKVTSTSGTSGAVRAHRATSNWDFGGVAPERLRIYFYAHDSGLFSFQLEVYTSSGNAYRYSKLQTEMNVDGWNAYDIYPDDWVLYTGTPDWAEGVFQVRYTVAPDGGGVTPAITFGAVYNAMQNTPAVMLSFDDSFTSDYDIAFAYMNPRNARGTTYTIESVVDAAGGLTSEELQEMDGAGWCVGVHGNINWAGEDDAASDAEIANCVSFLQGLGISAGWKHASYPVGGYDNFAIDRLKANGIVTGRVANTTIVGQLFVSKQNANGYYLGGKQIDAATSLATAKSYIDTAVNNNRLVGLFFHKLVASGAVSNQWNQADFEALIDYIIAQEVPFVTPIDLYNSISGSVSVPRAIT